MDKNRMKDSIVSRLGGVGSLARVCGVTPSAVSQWEDIPGRHLAAILAYARQNDITLDAEELINGNNHTEFQPATKE